MSALLDPKRALCIVFVVAMAMNGVDVTIVNPALLTIGTDFGVAPAATNGCIVAGRGSGRFTRDEAERLAVGHVVRQQPQCSADDFAVFAACVPGCYFMLCVGNGQQVYECHDPRFTIDEAALPVGAALLAASAVRMLEEARDR